MNNLEVTRAVFSANQPDDENGAAANPLKSMQVLKRIHANFRAIILQRLYLG